MISRRLIRIKVLQVLYSYFQSDESSFSKFEQQLFFSIHKSYDLYHYLMLLIIEISDFAKIRIEYKKFRRHKFKYKIYRQSVDSSIVYKQSIEPLCAKSKINLVKKSRFNKKSILRVERI